MKRLFAFLLLAGAASCGLYAQTVDTTVCDVLRNPKAFNGKMVRIKGTVRAGFDAFVVHDTDCAESVNGIWLSYPEGTKGKAGPLVMVTVQPAHNFAGKIEAPARTPVTLEKSKEFKQFDSLLSQQRSKGQGICLGCMRYEVQATLVGRLDGIDAADALLKRDASGKIIGFGGFGNMNAYPARLVLQSVSEVTPKEIDFSKSDTITKGNPPSAGGANAQYYEPRSAADKMVTSMPVNPLTVQMKQDLNELGKPNEQNGVVISFKGTANEADPKLEQPGSADSPDGVLFNCFINQGKLLPTEETAAIFYVGQHVLDLRHPQKGNEDAPAYILENNSWVVATEAAIYGGAKFITLPGGYLIWNSTWKTEEITDKMEAVMKDFLGHEELMSK